MNYFITNKSRNAVAISASWSRGDIENKHLYHAHLMCSKIKIDNEVTMTNIEWMVTKEDDPKFHMAVPLCFGFDNRNCDIIEEIEIFPSDTPFLMKGPKTKTIDGHEVSIEADDWEPQMLIFTKKTNDNKREDWVLSEL